MGPAPGARIWIATGVTDMRKGMQGLALLVQESFKRDPYAGDVFVFRGRGGDQATFNIRFALRQDRLPLASAVWPDAASLAPSARQGSDLRLYERAA